MKRGIKTLMTYTSSKLIKTGKTLKKFVSRIKTDFINGFNMEQFIKKLDGKIDIIIDIRYNTFFKRDQFFGPEDFKQALEANEIEYYYIQDLGYPFHNENKDNPVIAKERYLKYLEKALYSDGKKEFLPYNTLYKLFNQIAHKREYKTKTFSLVCSCNTLNPLRCRRFWLKEALINLGRQELELPEMNYEYTLGGK